MSTLPERVEMSPPALLVPLTGVREILEAQGKIAEFIKSGLKSGVDYGKIPGANKESLLKPGAERLCHAFGVIADFDVTEREVDHLIEIPWVKTKKVWNNSYQGDRSFREEKVQGSSFGLYRYVVKCRLISRQTGEVLGSGIGVCSSVESKYIDRPRDCENTILKMAEKRALVGAALVVFGLSDRFTQDVEDYTDATPPPSQGSKNALEWLSSFLSQIEISDFQTRCKVNSNSWTKVALQAKESGIASFDQLMDLATVRVTKKGVSGVASDEDVIEANFNIADDQDEGEGAAKGARPVSPITPEGSDAKSQPRIHEPDEKSAESVLRQARLTKAQIIVWKEECSKMGINWALMVSEASENGCATAQEYLDFITGYGQHQGSDLRQIAEAV